VSEDIGDPLQIGPSPQQSRGRCVSKDMSARQFLTARDGGIGPPNYTADQLTGHSHADGRPVAHEEMQVGRLWSALVEVGEDSLMDSLGYGKNPVSSRLARRQSQGAGRDIDITQRQVGNLSYP